MKLKNAVSNTYLARPERFAQICNHGLFGGKHLIQPDKLRELNAGELGLLEQGTGKAKVLEKNRDILRMYDDQMLLMVIGVENQTDIHYCMPLRNMLYDVLKYEDQRAEIEHRHRKEKDLHGAEFTSGFSKRDRLIPVMTLAVYWGPEPWDGPRNLHEILDIPPDLLQYKDRIGDYPVNLLEICTIDNWEHYNGELKALLGFVRYQKDPKALEAFVHDNEEIFRSVTPETAQAITVLGNAKEIQHYLNDRSEESEGTINMCQALQEMIQKGEEQGGIKVLILDNLEEGIPETRILEKLQRRFHLSAEDANEYLNKYRS